MPATVPRYKESPARRAIMLCEQRCGTVALGGMKNVFSLISVRGSNRPRHRATSLRSGGQLAFQDRARVDFNRRLAFEVTQGGQEHVGLVQGCLVPRRTVEEPMTLASGRPEFAAISQVDRLSAKGLAGRQQPVGGTEEDDRRGLSLLRPVKPGDLFEQARLVAQLGIDSARSHHLELMPYRYRPDIIDVCIANDQGRPMGGRENRAPVGRPRTLTIQASIKADCRAWST